MDAWMKPLLSILLAATLSWNSGVAAEGATDGTFDDRITGDWGGTRTQLSQAGVDMSLAYVNEWLRNTAGGERNATAYADQFALALDADLDTLLGWRGGSFHVLITNRNGPQLDSRAGLDTLLETHEIYGRGHYSRLTRFYLRQALFDDRLVLKLGRSDVDFFPLSCDFINLSFCGALPGYHSNGWYTWPIGQYFANATFRPTPRSYVKAGANDVNPRNLEGDQGLRLRTPHDDNDGVLANLEAGWLPVFGGRLDGAYLVGIWRNSMNRPDLLFDTQRGLMPLTGGDPLTHTRSDGWYAMAQQTLWTNDSGRSLTLFANFSSSDADVDRVDQIVSIGLRLHAPFADRPGDRIGFAIGQNRVSARARESQRQSNLANGENRALPCNETPVEVNYQFAVARGLWLMPSVQYVRNPGGRDDNDDAHVWGLKLSALF